MWRFRRLWALMLVLGVFVGGDLAEGAARMPSGHWVPDPMLEIRHDRVPSEAEARSTTLRLVAPLNGMASAQVVVPSAVPLRSIRAVITPLTLREPADSGDVSGGGGASGGGGTMGGSAGRSVISNQQVEIGYAIRYRGLGPDGRPIGEPADRFVAVAEQAVPGERVQPVWVTVQVPEDAAPGRYTGTLRLTPGGTVPVELDVIGFPSPDPWRFTTHAGMIQSPETIARHYGVPLWSPRHLQLLEPSLRLLGQSGNRVLFIPLVNRTHLGNEESMVRFVRRGGRFTPDFTPLERYLELYSRHSGPPEVIVLYAWETAWRGDRTPATIGVTEVDPRGGRTQVLEVPFFGRPGTEAFWRPVFEGIAARVEQLQWPTEAIMLGMAGDARPDPETTEFFNRVASGFKWAMFTHARGDPNPRDGRLNVSGLEVGYRELPYPTDLRRYNPASPIGGGWDTDFRQVTSLRSFDSDASAAFRLAATYSLASNRYSGFSRIGLDFWPVEGSPLIGRHHRWHNLYRGNLRASTVPGPRGALPTIGLLFMREGMQETEAQIIIERVLRDSNLADQLTEAEREAGRKVLDQRMRFLIDHRGNWSDFGKSGEDSVAHARELYTVADQWRRRFDLSVPFERAGGE
ncbi:MAG: hypothetical protein JJU36_03600 [Phycisphaeraceae bacterium]|nr:hypothetical protein [Phycisphaeraceae bacterium]